MSWYTKQLYFFFFNDTATTEIYTLSLHDALPISWKLWSASSLGEELALDWKLGEFSPDPRSLLQKYFHFGVDELLVLDRKSTRLNSSHANISYAVFCLKKKNKIQIVITLVSPTHH